MVHLVPHGGFPIIEPFGKVVWKMLWQPVFQRVGPKGAEGDSDRG